MSGSRYNDSWKARMRPTKSGNIELDNGFYPAILVEIALAADIHPWTVRATAKQMLAEVSR